MQPKPADGEESRQRGRRTSGHEKATARDASISKPARRARRPGGPCTSRGRACEGAATAGASQKTSDRDVLYVVGGLYGNAFALNAVEQLASKESGNVRICFNGDFNWFNKSLEDF